MDKLINNCLNILNDCTDSSEKWKFEKHHFKLLVYNNEQEQVLSDIENLINCRYTYELNQNDSFYIIITFPTLYSILYNHKK